MKFSFISLFIVAIMFVSGCGLQSQRNELRQKQIELRQKEQELALKEQELNAREQILNERQKQMDSVMVAHDTLSVHYPDIPGNWLVKMVCTEAGCAGSALGDTKVEQWLISFQNNMVIVKAMNNKFQLSRIYTGKINPDGKINIRASTPNTGANEEPSAIISASISMNDKGSMSGQRVITQSNGCQIVYSLNLNKQS